MTMKKQVADQVRPSEAEAHSFWEAWLDAELNAKFWSCMIRSRQNWDQRFQIFIAVLASGTVASWNVWSEYPIVWKILSGSVAVATIIQPLLHLNSDVDIMSQIYSKWMRIENAYEALWHDAEHLKREDAVARHRELCGEIAELDERSVKLPRNDRLRNKCFSEICRSRKLEDPLAKKGMTKWLTNRSTPRQPLENQNVLKKEG